ncbi:MAG: TolC family protein [Candidatus Rokubacteria bacterium]|nr:TolC family protein [Candidatus Rokubacteria bacterium]
MGSRPDKPHGILVVAALMLVLASPGAADGPRVDPAALTLDEAIALALDHAPKLHDARAKVALARLDVRGTRWWTWLIPAVTAHQGFDFLSAQERAAIALSLDLSKFLGKGAREAEQAQHGLAQAERALEVTRTEVVTEVTRAVFQLTSARAAIEVREDAVAHALKLQALEAIRFEHGTGDLGPLLRAREALARARLELLTARHEAHLGELALRRAIGLPLP